MWDCSCLSTICFDCLGMPFINLFANVLTMNKSIHILFEFILFPCYCPLDVQLSVVAGRGEEEFYQPTSCTKPLQP